MQLEAGVLATKMCFALLYRPFTGSLKLGLQNHGQAPSPSLSLCRRKVHLWLYAKCNEHINIQLCCSVISSGNLQVIEHRRCIDLCESWEQLLKTITVSSLAVSETFGFTATN